MLNGSQISVRVHPIVLLGLMAAIVLISLISQAPYPSQAKVSQVVAATATPLAPCSGQWVQCGNNIYPLADAYVRKGSPTNNYGNSTQLIVAVDLSGTPTNDAYLKFDLGTIPAGRTFKSATMWMCGRMISSGRVNVLTVDLYSVSNTTWGETTINWNNRPAFGAKVASGSITKGWDSTTTWDCTSWNVSSFVQQKLNAGTPIVTLGVRLAGFGYVEYLSREYASEIPVSGHRVPLPVIQTAWQ